MDRLLGILLSTVLDQTVTEDANAVKFGKGSGNVVWYLLNRAKNPQLQEVTVATSIPRNHFIQVQSARSNQQETVLP